jgi:four helix bundle protein
MLKDAEQVADGVWRDVDKWQAFARNTMGEQIVRAVDSIGANIAESYGRFHYGEKLKFLYYARGSLFETKYWLNRTSARGLITDEKAQGYAAQLFGLARQINAFAGSLKSQRYSNSKSSNLLRETVAEYSSEIEDINPLFGEDELNWLQTLPNDLQSPNLQSPNL